MGWLASLRGALTGGMAEVSRDNLIAAVVSELGVGRVPGARGSEVMPDAVRVLVTVSKDRVGVTERLVRSPVFDRDVERGLLNRWVRIDQHELPLRTYEVGVGVRALAVRVEAVQGASLHLAIDGGDRDGAVLEVPAGRRVLRMGRGPWHGPHASQPNDLRVSERLAWVSRRAARLRRRGGCLEVQSLDQAECLTVVRANGARVRPVRSAELWVAVGAGDRIELHDGHGQVISLTLAEVP